MAELVVSRYLALLCLMTVLPLKLEVLLSRGRRSYRPGRIEDEEEAIGNARRGGG